VPKFGLDFSESFFSFIISKPKIVVEEILSSEAEYVSNLDHVVTGYLEKCEASAELFPPELIAVLFSNIRNLLEFHVRLLRRLKRAVRENSVAAVGRMFITNKKSFEIYREYCFNFDTANEKLVQIQKHKHYSSFLNHCRTDHQR